MVYTNLTSEVRISSLLNCPAGSYMDTASVSSDYNIATQTIMFKDSGFDRNVTVERIFGDTVVTTITQATSIKLNVQIMIDDDAVGTTTVQEVLTNLNGLQNKNIETNTVSMYDEGDTKRRHRLALIWTNEGISYMKVYYNAYVKMVSMIKENPATISIDLEVPVMDIETGNGNYYEYEGVGPTSVLTSIDKSMNWA